MKGFDSHEIYIHPLLGEVYALLQKLVPGVSWYYLGELAILGLAMAALYRMAMERDGCVPVLAVLTLFYAGGLLFGLQYTKIAGTASAAKADTHRAAVARAAHSMVRNSLG